MRRRLEGLDLTHLADGLLVESALVTDLLLLFQLLQLVVEVSRLVRNFDLQILPVGLVGRHISLLKCRLLGLLEPLDQVEEIPFAASDGHSCGGSMVVRMTSLDDQGSMPVLLILQMVDHRLESLNFKGKVDA